MELLDSLVLLKHGSTTLVAIGDPMWEPVRLNGGQAVEEIALIRADGIKVQPRGNQRNTVDFVIAVEQSTVEAALKTVFAHPATLPLTMADVTITFADGSGIRIKNASINSWDGGHESTIARLTARITGGEIQTIAAP